VSRILIAEDEERISSFVERGLRSHGFATTVVDNGVLALALARSGEFDLLLLDIGLPALDGFSLLLHFARAAPPCP
jgi:DNA-binding response OmpR family regulator